ncbi:hypothetical protein [Pseudomonas shirazensis]
MSYINHKEFNKNILYIYYLPKSVREGGMARNKAFYETFNLLEAKMFNMFTKNILVRLVNNFKVLIVLFFVKKKTIFIHQGTLLFIFSMFLLRINFFRRIIFIILNRISKNNKLIIEINDLIYEQSIDLELKVDEVFRILQKDIFAIKDCNYIFASNEMAFYVMSKYCVPTQNSRVILNGAPRVQDYSHTIKNEEWMNSIKNKFVYAGSLNKGRQIEDLLNVFKDQENSLLIILGNEGEWLHEFELPENVIYLGNYEEGEAHYIVSKCDIGIIPYKEDRFYYNICFPTKASFYLTAGLPILSTPLNELQKVFEDKGVVLFSSFKDWINIVNNIDSDTLFKMKKNTMDIKDEYYWESLLSHIKF